DLAGKRVLYKGDRVFSTAELKMGRGSSGKLVTEVKKALFKAAPESELSITDGSPGIGCPVIASVNGMDLVLIIAEPSGSGISDLKRLCKTAESFRTKLAVCVNKYDISPESADEIESFCKEEGLPFVGRIPYDPQAVEAVNGGGSVVDKDCPSGRAIRNIYSELRKILELD
ncbi:MAG: ATPase, partial [Lachnospiraceae bacterium]|nr:ATPase [Lachnospiraceae bacterium]